MDGNMKRAKLRLAPLTLIQQQQPGVESPLKPKSIEIKSAPPQISFKIENKFTSHLALNRKRYFIIFTLALLILGFLMYLLISKEIRKLYFSPLNRYDLPPLRQLTPTLQHFLKEKNIHRLLNVRCGMKCLLNQRDDILKQAGIQVYYEDVVEEVHLDGDSKFYDWINVHSYGVVDPQEIQRLAQSSKIGIAIFWQQQSYYSLSHQNLKQIYQLFKTNGLYYNTIESLNLRRMQSQIIQIFTRVQKNSQVIRGIENYYNFIAIQTTINLYKDIPFLRQWIVYHLTIGVDKIFIYDTFDSGDQEQVDNGDYGCDGVQAQAIYEEFQKIWEDFYFSIVYVPWSVEKRKFGFPFGWVQPDPQHDYIYNFKLATKYTIFLKPHQMLFSKFGVKISDPLKTNRSCYTINRKLFLDRTCTGHQHMLQNYQYLPLHEPNRPQSPIFQTQNYLPYYLTSNGYIFGNKCTQIGQNEYKINSYELTKSKIKELQKQNTYKSMYFSYDYSAQSRIPMIRILCHRNRVITVEDVCGKVDQECFVPMTKIS